MTLALLLAVLGSPAAAQEVQGFVEVRGSALIGVDGEVLQVVERVRPTFEAPLHDRVKLSTTVELGLSQGRRMQDELQRTLDESDLGPLLELAECEWPEEDNALFDISSVDDYLSVDRLFVDWYHPAFDLRVGRQSLQWGSAQFINPTDPFPEVLFTEPWKPRAGVNSTRITVPIGDMHQVQGVVGTNDTFDKARLAARGTVNALQTDFSVVSAYRQEGEELLTGVDIRGTLGVGFWVEGALHAKGLLGDEVEDDLYEELAVGVDYSLPILDMFLVSAQYYRDGAGSTDPGQYNLSVMASGVEIPTCGDIPEIPGVETPDPSDLFGTDDGTVDPFAPRFAGQNYGLLTAMVAFNPEVSANAAWLQNFDDGTSILVPTVSTQPVGSLEISVSAQIPVKTWGNGGEFSPRPRDLVLEVPVAPGLDPLQVDLAGLVPEASVFLWTRVGF